METYADAALNRRVAAGATVVITGASSGLGRGTALKLAARGANVVVAARRGEALDTLVAAIQAGGGSALAVPTDVSNAEEVAALADAAVQKYNRIDVWINNVGVGTLGLFWEVPLEDYSRLIDVNLKGVIYGANAALKQFRKQGFGTLINIGSIDSEVPLAYQAVYAATKAAVLSLSRSLAEELRLAGNRHIKVSTILPWAVDTPWWTHAANYSGHTPRMVAMHDPEMVVDAIVRACDEPKTEIPVGWTSRTSSVAHRVMPGVTEYLSASVVHWEVRQGPPAMPNKGAVHEPMEGTVKVDGGVRERMRQEDAASERSAFGNS